MSSLWINGRTTIAIAALAFATSLGGCASLGASLGAKKHYGAAQRAEKEGDLATALREYDAASRAQPDNAEYREALDRTRRVASESHVAAARQAEAQQDYAKAAEHWRSADEFMPAPHLRARMELATLRTKRSDPLEYYLATEKLAKAMPNDAEAQSALEQARSEAFRYYTKLAETFFDTGSFTTAYESFESARKVRPDDDTFKGIKYRIARARHLEATGDERSKKGEHLAAFRAYEEAASYADLPGLQAKKERARKGAGSLIEQLEQARAFERLQKWEDAAEIYTLIRDRSDAPADVAGAAQRTRLESAKLRAARATAYAKQGNADQAAASFALALEHTDAPAETMRLLHDGLEAVQSGQAGLALEHFQAAQRATASLPVNPAALDVASVRARAELEAAKAQASSDPAEAMLRVSRLAAFSDSLPGYAAVRQKLVKRAFAVLLERAEAQAADGKATRAAELFKTALEIAKAPPNVQGPLEAGAAALKIADYRSADESFKKASAADTRSRLARAGISIAGALRLSELRREAKEAEAVEDPVRAAVAYKQILELQPDDPVAKQGLENLRPALISRSIAAADAHRAAGRSGSAWVYYRRVLDLDKLHPGANDAITSLSGAFELRQEPLAWVAPVRRGDRLGAACAGAEKDLRDRMILYLTRTRNLGAEYLQRDASTEIDAKKRPLPAIELASALEHCAVNTAGGRVDLTLQLRVGGQPLMTERVGAGFDPKSLPKDEAEAGIDEAKVLDSILKETARLVALAVQPHAPKLRDWRVTEARARMRANDDEGSAASYAVLTLSGEKLTASEREVLRELERYILNRFR